MLLNINPKNKKPLYIQIYERIKNKINQSELLQGQKLPSKRQLALNNGVSQNTVMKAYDQLLVEGYIRSEERRGYFVEDIDFLQMPLQSKRSPEDFELEKKKNKTPLLDLTRSNPDPSLFPFSVFSKIYTSLLNSQDEGLLRASKGQGLFELRHEVAAYLSQSRGVPCQTDQLILAPNSQLLLEILFNLYSEIQQIGMEDPGYSGYQSLFKVRQIEEKAIPVDQEGITIDELYKSGVDTVFVTPNHQFPTGSIMPLERRQQLLIWAQEKPDRIIIEDDYDSEFKYSGIPVPPLIQLDHHQQVVYLGSFTRILSPSIRLSYLVLPEKMMKRFNSLYTHLSSSLNSFTQYAVYKFIKDGHFTSHLNRSRRLYKKKRDLLIQSIQKIDSKAIFYGEEAGLSLLVKPSHYFNGPRLQELCLKEGIRLNLLSDYKDQPSEQDEKILFLSFSSIPLEKIDQLIKKIYQLIKKSILK